MIETEQTLCGPCELGNHTGTNGTPGCLGGGCRCRCQNPRLTDLPGVRRRPATPFTVTEVAAATGAENLPAIRRRIVTSPAWEYAWTRTVHDPTHDRLDSIEDWPTVCASVVRALATWTLMGDDAKALADPIGRSVYPDGHVSARVVGLLAGTPPAVLWVAFADLVDAGLIPGEIHYENGGRAVTVHPLEIGALS